MRCTLYATVERTRWNLGIERHVSRMPLLGGATFMWLGRREAKKSFQTIVPGARCADGRIGRSGRLGP